MPQAVPTAATPRALSVRQMLHLMRLEVDQAQLHGYPISSMMIALDGFDTDADRQLQRMLMPAIFRELKGVTVDDHVRGLGLTKGHIVLGVFPHIPPERTEVLARKLLERGRALRPPGLAEDRIVTLSVGISHNMHPQPVTFPVFLEEAETGLNVAQSSGGDRCVQWKEVETELDHLRAELEEQIREVAGEQSFAEEQAGKDEDWGRNLIQRILTMFQAEPEQSPGVVRLQRDVIALVNEELARWRETSSFRMLAERESQIDLLERRVRKLTENLDVTESELHRVAALKNVDTGLSSLYRSVQGLTDDSSNAEQKLEMLTGIFEANRSLQGGEVLGG